MWSGSLSQRVGAANTLAPNVFFAILVGGIRSSSWFGLKRLTGFSLTIQLRILLKNELWGAKIEMMCITAMQKIDRTLIPWLCMITFRRQELSLSRGNNPFLWCKGTIKTKWYGVFFILDVKRRKRLSICNWNWKTQTWLRFVYVKIQSVASGTKLSLD